MLAYATEMKSIQLHDSIVRLNQKMVSFTLHYMITIHYIELYTYILLEEAGSLINWLYDLYESARWCIPAAIGL